MGSFFAELTSGGAMPALQTTWSFAQQKHRVIADNIANISTPNYKAKRLDYGAFQSALGEALEERKGKPKAPFVLKASDQFRMNERGQLETTPSIKPGRNGVFHDGTNLSIEAEMSDLAANAMLHEMTTTLVNGYFGSLRKAISGRL